MTNAAQTLDVSLQGEIEDMGLFRLAVAKYSLVNGIPYKVRHLKLTEGSEQQLTVSEKSC